MRQTATKGNAGLRRLALALPAMGLLLTLPSLPVESQEPSLGNTPAQSTIELSTSGEVLNHYALLERQLRGSGAEELKRLYDEYTAALRELSAENSRRAAALMEQSTESRRQLSGADISIAERTQRNQEIQDGYTGGMTELREWYAASRQTLDEQYASARTAFRSEIDASVARLHTDREAALVRLRATTSGILVPLEVPAPEGPVSPVNPDVRTGAEDGLANDGRVADALPDIQLHPVRWDLRGGSRYSHPDTQFPPTLTIDTCSIRIQFSAGYSLFMDGAPTEDQISAVPITGFMKIGREEVVRINERANYTDYPRRAPEPLAREIEEPHGFGWLNGDIELSFGEHFVSAVVDDVNRVLENNEGNNAQSFRFTIVPDPDADLDCVPDSIAAAAVDDNSPAGGQAADLGNSGNNVAIPDENAARAALSQANLVLELDTPMSERIRIRNTGRTETTSAATLSMACTDSAGEPCLPTWEFREEVDVPASVPPLGAGEVHDHYIVHWPRTIFWGPGTYDFEIRLNADNAVAESSRGNYENVRMTVPNHSTGQIVDYCVRCHALDDRGIGPAPSVLLEYEDEVGFDTLVQSVIYGPTGMGAKAQLMWLPDERVPEVLQALLDRGR